MTKEKPNHVLDVTESVCDISCFSECALQLIGFLNYYEISEEVMIRNQNHLYFYIRLSKRTRRRIARFFLESFWIEEEVENAFSSKISDWQEPEHILNIVKAKSVTKELLQEKMNTFSSFLKDNDLGCEPGKINRALDTLDYIHFFYELRQELRDQILEIFPGSLWVDKIKK